MGPCLAVGVGEGIAGCPRINCLCGNVDREIVSEVVGVDIGLGG